MNLGLAATVFFVMFFAELPDKTMIATLIMGSRGQPRAVWLGASLGFVVQMAIASVAGRFLNKLPHTALEIAITLVFLGGAVYLLFVPESSEVAEGETEAAAQAPKRFLATAGAAFGVILVAEFGDLTQLLAAGFVARSGEILTVFIASSLALIVVSGIGSFGGQALLKVLPLARIRQGGGILLLGFGIYTLVTLLTS